ncbi:hypothetical protein AC790_08915 [Pantoea sp. RIT-PI-b]|nr:hypothetical protein AC790_08915 [Pantoea sp. RIT-PI-b]
MNNSGNSLGQNLTLNTNNGAWLRHINADADGTSYIFSQLGGVNNYFIGTPNTGGNRNLYINSYVLGTQIQIQSDRVFANKFMNAPAFTPTSDERIKTERVIMTNAIDKVLQLQGYESYKLTFSEDNTFTTGGLLAQDVQKVMPVAVKSGGGNGLNENGDLVENLLSVDYNALSALFVEAIKELSAKINQLEVEVASLK